MSEIRFRVNPNEQTPPSSGPGPNVGPVAARPAEPAPLEIPRDLHDAMVEHCRTDAPLECCGVLVGTAPRASLRVPLRNDAPEAQRAVRYFAAPRDLIALDRILRERELNLLAIYHSHPSCPAVPSRADLELNYYGDLPRIIVSLAGAAPDVRVWRLGPDRYDELPWRIVEPAGP